MTLIDQIRDIDELWKVLFFSVGILSIMGLLPSIYSCNWGWFSRSGSLLVVYGVYVVWRDYQGRIDFTLTEVEVAAKRKLGDVSEELSQTISQIKTSNKELYQTMEFSIFGVGTLIWGYGDLVGGLYC